MSYDVRDWLSDIGHGRLGYAYEEAFYYLRNNNWRCVLRIHKYESYYRPNWTRTDYDDGVECVYCGKDPGTYWEPLRWRVGGWFYGTRLGQAISDWQYRRYVKRHPETEFPF